MPRSFRCFARSNRAAERRHIRREKTLITIVAGVCAGFAAMVVPSPWMLARGTMGGPSAPGEPLAQPMIFGAGHGPGCRMHIATRASRA